jgi:predicted PurR-regulated permease PerM
MWRRGSESSEVEPESVPAASASALSAMLSLQVGAIVVAALYLAREVLIPITVSILLSFVLSPLVDLLRRFKLGRVPSVLLSVGAAIGIIMLVGTIIGSQVAQLATHAPEYAITIEQKVASVRDYALTRISGVLERFGYDAKPSRPETSKSTPAGPGKSALNPDSQADQPASPSTPLELIKRYLAPIFSPIATIGIIVVVAIFVLLQKEDLRDRMIRLFGSTDLHRTTVALDDAAQRLSKYFLTQLAINAAFGVIIGVGLFLIGVPNPILWAILSGLLRFVPYIGSFISAILPIALATAVDPGWSMAIWTTLFYIVAELAVSQGVEPVLYGHSTGLSPFAVVISAIFWSWLWGSVGLVLSMPLTLCLVVLGRYVDRLELLDVLLGDRPPLTPIESFYQRILAGDADEAQDHAELLLKERHLSSYYDEVAVEGMQLAASDAERGVIRQRQLEKVRNTIKDLVDELADHEDHELAAKAAEPQASGLSKDQRELPKAPPSPDDSPDKKGLPLNWQTETPILCLAGRGPLDEAASSMLAQLLRKHGLGARVASYRSASREGITSLEVNGAAMVCISYLNIRGSPSHLRFLMQRLRKRLPAVPISVGLWPKGDKVLTDKAVSTAIGADYYVTSLREAVNACIETSKKAAIQSGPARDSRTGYQYPCSADPPEEKRV